jgi:uncharacterized membrane protein YfcA
MPGILIAGALVGLVYGLFGVGSAFATPALSFLGIPPLTAVVSPLPAFLPSSLAGAWSYARRDSIDRPLAARVVAGALPAAIAGALTSQYVGGPILLTLQAAVLLLIGTRLLTPTPARSAGRRAVGGVWVVVGAVVVGFLAGLLANGGGFLLVPWFLMVLGLDMHRATGTSLLVAATLTVPTIAVHALVGDVDWLIAIPFAAGVVPGAVVGAHLAQRLPTGRLRLAFGALLVAIGAWYLLRCVL